jgi:hypothetical protein
MERLHHFSRFAIKRIIALAACLLIASAAADDCGEMLVRKEWEVQVTPRLLTPLLTAWQGRSF